jgi:hypothetical protein
MRPALLFLLAAVSCQGDLTIRYNLYVKPGAGLPSALADGVMKQVAASMPKERVLRIKGEKTSTGVGVLTGIFDNRSFDLTLLNPATKQ